jgi:hypothetical protein
MSLRSLLANPDDLYGSVALRAPDVRKLRRSARQIEQNGGEAKAAISVAEWQARIIAAHRQGMTASLTPRELRFAAIGFFDPPSPLAAQDELCASILHLIAVRRLRAAVRELIALYLERFDPALPGFGRVASWLNEIVREWDWEWHHRARAYHLFEIDKAPRLLAEQVIKRDQPPAATLADIGLGEMVTGGNLGEAVFAAACRDVAELRPGDAEAHQSRLIAWAFPSDRFQFNRVFPAFVSALLKPWAQATPPEAHQSLISRVLLAVTGDPRIWPTRWESVKRDAPQSYAILLRWLTRTAVYQFFDIVNQTADVRMWQYRRAFWTSYLEAGHIEEAWVVFGANGARLAERTMRLVNQDASVTFGKLTAGEGRTPDHAALLMKIGDLVIAEWSHSGKYNIWDHQDRKAPKLYQEHYAPKALMYAPTGGSHMGAESFAWQNTVAKIIRESTGRSTTQVTWRPK